MMTSSPHNNKQDEEKKKRGIFFSLSLSLFLADPAWKFSSLSSSPTIRGRSENEKKNGLEETSALWYVGSLKKKKEDGLYGEREKEELPGFSPLSRALTAFRTGSIIPSAHLLLYTTTLSRLLIISFWIPRKHFLLRWFSSWKNSGDTHYQVLKSVFFVSIGFQGFLTISCSANHR